MEYNFSFRAFLLVALNLFVSSCGQAGATNVLPTGLALTLSPSQTATPADTPTPEFTPTVFPPVLDLTKIEDERSLDSFILEMTDAREFDSPECVDQTQCVFQVSIGYVQEPFSMFRTDSSNYVEEAQSYSCLLDGILYRHIPTFFDFQPRNEVYFRPDDDLIDGFFDLSEFDHYPDTLWGRTFIDSAQFLAQEEYEGIPANHFIIDQTNLSVPTGEFVGEIQEAEGEIYLSLDGKYLFYVSLRLTGELGNRELTRKLTSINRLNEFTLPAAFPKDEMDPGLPLPEGAYLFSYDVNPDWGVGVSKYDICMPSAMTPEDFLAFYQDLPETNGWKVNGIGGPLPGSVWYGLYDFDMVQLTKGSQQLYIYAVSYGVASPPAGCKFATAELHN